MPPCGWRQPVGSRGLSGGRVWRDGVPAGSAAAWPAFYAVGVETLTFLFTDIEGSTALLGRLGDDDYARVLAGHHALIRSALAAHEGSEMDTQGDAFFAVFSSPRACVAAVLQMQQALAAHAWPGGERVRVRMGIHCGEAARTATGLVGLEVHRAARVAAVGYGGQVLVSEAAAVLVRDGLPPGAALADLGVHRLKDLGRPERIFQLTAAGLPAQFPPLRSLGNPALPNNLPAQLSTFIGRDREVAEVRALVESCAPGHLDRGRRVRARPGWGCRWPPSCWMGPGTGCGWWSWPRSPTRTRCRRPSRRRCGWPSIRPAGAGGAAGCPGAAGCADRAG